ncbi:MAG: diguanylate cyclase [Dechloromonas sp.]|nr:diguanylate cyclase [Dechloromonas sp.]
MVLDSAIVAVVSGMTLDRDDGRGLLERLRDSKLSRLRNVPFVLMVSSSFSDADRREAEKLGVTGFIVKGATSPSVESIVSAQMEWREGPVEGAPSASSPYTEESLEQFSEQSDIGISNIMGQVAGLEPKVTDASDEDELDEDDTVLAEEMVEEYLANSLPEAQAGSGVGVLAFGLDGYNDLVVNYGTELAFSSAQRFCTLLSRKIRPEDFIGQLADGRVVIVTRATSGLICAGFANRICKAMASAQITVEGQRINLTVSVGVAVVPEDGDELSEQGLLQLAYDRLAAAAHAGGNRVVASSGRQDAKPGNCHTFVPDLKELLATIDPAAMTPCLGTIGMQLMPLLRELDKNFRFGLPIEEMNKRLWDRARAERMMT